MLSRFIILDNNHQIITTTPHTVLYGSINSLSYMHYCWELKLGSIYSLFSISAVKLFLKYFYGGKFSW